MWNVFGNHVMQRTNCHVNHHLEEDHRGIKRWYPPFGEFKQGSNPARCCRTFEEVRGFLCPQSQRHPPCSLA
jgi:putative transposase